MGPGESRWRGLQANVETAAFVLLFKEQNVTPYFVRLKNPRKEVTIDCTFLQLAFFSLKILSLRLTSADLLSSFCPLWFVWKTDFLCRGSAGLAVLFLRFDNSFAVLLNACADFLKAELSN